MDNYKDTDRILNNKLRDWFQKAIAQIKFDGLSQDIHLDELIVGDYKALSRTEIFNWSYRVFENLIQYITVAKIDIFEFNLFLSFELESESNVFQGKPFSVSEIETSLDMFSVPEIILYHDVNPNIIPMVELYRTPLILDSFAENKNISVFYKEYRTLEEQISNSNYTRDINIVYKPDSI